MSEREKKIAEIREGYKSERDDNFTYKKEIVEQDIRFLLSELDREREKNRKLREQRDAYYKNAQFAEAAAHGIEKLREENRKMIEVLRWYGDERRYEFTNVVGFSVSEMEVDRGKRARNILKEIGVRVE